MANIPSFEEIEGRINNHLSRYMDKVPVEVVICWGGYIAALLEWGLISINDHEKLSNLLPKVEANPVIDIFSGKD